MDPSYIPQLIILVILLILSGFFSSAETALVSVNEIRIRTLADENNKKALRVIKLLSQKDKMISAILIGNNIVNLTASSITTSMTIKISGSMFVGVSTGILTFIILVFGEVIPKIVATKKSEKMSLVYSRPIYLFMIIMTPLIFIVNGCSKILLRIVRFKEDQGPTLTDDDIQTVLDVSHEEGVLENEEHEMLTNLVSFGDTKVKDVMVPKIHVNFVNSKMSLDELMELFRDKKNTRYPVYSDTDDEVIGIINMKDILIGDFDNKTFKIDSILRKPYFTYENKSTLELLTEMKKEALGVSVVLDEYGATSGLVTLEDLLEEIVGEIHDEYDEEELDQIRQISARTFIVEGSTPITECNEELNLELESEDYDSIGGYIIEHLDKMPSLGDFVFTEKGDKLTIKRLDGNRIDIVYVLMNNVKAKE